MVYPASKAALAWWARREGVKDEWIGAGIRLNSVAPGKIATAMTEQLAADPVFGPLSEAYPTAIGRDGRAEEIAGADRVPALGRRLAGRRLGALRRRRHRRDPAPGRPGGLGRPTSVRLSPLVTNRYHHWHAAIAACQMSGRVSYKRGGGGSCTDEPGVRISR